MADAKLLHDIAQSRKCQALISACAAAERLLTMARHLQGTDKACSLLPSYVHVAKAPCTQLVADLEVVNGQLRCSVCILLVLPRANGMLDSLLLLLTDWYRACHRGRA